MLLQCDECGVSFVGRRLLEIDKEAIHAYQFHLGYRLGVVLEEGNLLKEGFLIWSFRLAHIFHRLRDDLLSNAVTDKGGQCYIRQAGIDLVQNADRVVGV